MMHKIVHTHTRNLVDLIFPRRQKQDIDSLLEERCKRIFQLIDGIKEKNHSFIENEDPYYLDYRDHPKEVEEINSYLEGFFSIHALEVYGKYVSFRVHSSASLIRRGIYCDNKELKILLDEKGIDVIRGKDPLDDIFKSGAETIAALREPRLYIQLSYVGREYFLKNILKTVKDMSTTMNYNH